MVSITALMRKSRVLVYIAAGACTVGLAFFINGLLH